MWAEGHSNVVVKAIGTVESGMNYAAINHNDPITVGIAQWFGVRAAALLHRMRSENLGSTVGMSPSLLSDLNNHSASDTFWNSRRLTSGEGNSLKPILQANRTIQNDQFRTDISGYLSVADSWGLDVQNNIQAVQFFCTMYHQSPARTLDVINAIGTSPTLEQIYQGALANPVLGQYRERQKTARDIIAAQDSSGVEDGSGPPVDQDNPEYEPIEVPAETMTHVSRQGDMMLVHFKGISPVLTYPATAGEWIPRENGIGGGVVDPGDTPNPDPDPDPGTPGPWHNPLDNQRCTNRYGRLSYTNYHSGIDMGAKVPGVPGDPVYAIHAGTVVRVGGHNQVLVANSGRGLILDMGVHNGDRMFMYCGHLNSVDVAQGTKVEAGQQIATMGGTGANHSNSDFDVHLHLVIFKNKVINTSGPTTVGRTHTIDPEPYLRGKGILQDMNSCPYN